MAGTKHSDSEKAAILERQRQALELRKGGASLRGIADKLMVSHVQVRRDINSALALSAKELKQDADRLRALELERLDSMLLAISSQVLAGHLGAIDRALRIMERRAKLLGLDAPTKLQHTGEDGGPIPIAVVKMDMEEL